MIMHKKQIPQDDFLNHFRHEWKFICSPEQLIRMENRVRMVCGADPHVNENGIYNVRSLYFDTFHDRYYEESKAGTNIRHKYRIRVYGENRDRIALEKKSNINGFRQKETEIISAEQYEKLMKGILPQEFYQAKGLIGEFCVEFLRQKLTPRVIVAYQRTPFVYEIGNTRITFDRNISASQSKNLFAERLAPRSVMSSGFGVLECKFDSVLPEPVRCLFNSEKNMRRTSFSKYAACRDAWRVE